MIQQISKYILYNLLGWKKTVTVDHPNKYIICIAPHTSNWDFLIGQLYAKAEGIKANFLMKKEWFFWPLGPMFKAMGGIPVWRSKNCSMTDNLAEQAKKMQTFHLCITPEGTRSLNPEWKKGAYYITSGILDVKEEVVKEAVLAAGLTLVEVTHQGEWVCVTARKD